MQEPLLSQRYFLQFKAVRLECLDEHQQPLNKVASGFVMREAEALFLYTCWHVVTGFDPHHIEVGFVLPKCRFLRVSLQDVKSRSEGLEAIGGEVSRVLPLYQNSQPPFGPLWSQDERHVPQSELNNIGIHVPFWHDVIKIRLPDDLSPSDLQLVNAQRSRPVNAPLICPGDKCLVVGYPYGFSALGKGQPTPIVLTRYVAATRINERPQQFLLESAGAPGMSGGPVFLERDQDIYLIGLYTGCVFPDSGNHAKEKTTALGTVSDLTLVFREHLPLVSIPSLSVPF